MNAAPLVPGALEPTLQPLGRSRTLPADVYISDDVFAWEQRHFFADSWSCVGRNTVLMTGPDGKRVTQRAVVVGDVPVLLTWPAGESDGVRALANTCRHRGHEILPAGDTAGKRALTCPYHAWTYALDGRLAGAPGFRDVASFDPAEHGLIELPVEVWHGWVFVNATGRSAPFVEHIGGLDDLVAPYAPERLVVLAERDYEVAANWKVVVENYHECYHCPMIHPELCRVSPPSSGENFDLPGAWVGGSMDLRDGAVTMSLDGASAGLPMADVDARRVLYLGLFPNLLISLHPDYVMTHRLTPLAPGRSAIECAWQFVEGVTDPAFAVDFWDRTNRQDWAACESVQRGLASPHFRPGPFAPNEDAVHDWVTMIGRAYQGIPPHLPPTDRLGGV